MGYLLSRNRSRVWNGTVILKKLFRPSSSLAKQSESQSIMVVHNNEGRFSSNAYDLEEFADFEFQSREDIAAITIQTCFRAHLARRAFRALRSLVRLQAVVRGVIVRRQSRIALECMHALARIHLTIQARHFLLNND